jgi:hypothetical protein
LAFAGRQPIAGCDTGQASPDVQSILWLGCGDHDPARRQRRQSRFARVAAISPAALADFVALTGFLFVRENAAGGPLFGNIVLLG